MHKKEADLYCSKCEEPICKECVEGEHHPTIEGHEVERLLTIG